MLYFFLTYLDTSHCIIIFPFFSSQTVILLLYVPVYFCYFYRAPITSPTVGHIIKNITLKFFVF